VQKDPNSERFAGRRNSRREVQSVAKGRGQDFHRRTIKVSEHKPLNTISENDGRISQRREDKLEIGLCDTLRLNIRTCINGNLER
jgi:hypothetical protein